MKEGPHVHKGNLMVCDFCPVLASVLLTLGAHAQRVTVVVLCVCVCLPVFSILPSRAFRRPLRSVSGYSAENAVKLESHFL